MSQQTKIVKERLFLPKIKNMTKCLPSPLLFRTIHEVLARASSQSGKIKKKKSTFKTALFIGSTNMDKENLKNYTHKKYL